MGVKIQKTLFFFVDAHYTHKLSPGAAVISVVQRQTLAQQRYTMRFFVTCPFWHFSVRHLQTHKMRHFFLKYVHFHNYKSENWIKTGLKV